MVVTWVELVPTMTNYVYLFYLQNFVEILSNVLHQIKKVELFLVPAPAPPYGIQQKRKLK